MSSSKPTITRITLQGDGAHGSDGVDGQDGVDGFRRSSNPLNASTWHGTDGSNATIPEPGKDGLDITLTLSTLEESEADDQTNGQKKKVKVHATSTQQKEGTNDDKLLVLWDEVYGLNHIPTIRWSTTGGNGGNGARGGHGGNGAPGLNGTDARPPDIPGSDGTPGGNGGKGGVGSSGAKAGNGGTMTVKVNEKDSYLLSLLDPCTFKASLLCGGKGGKVGKHGPGGVGGLGGKGGKSITFTTDEDKKKKIVIPGGKGGMSGADGLTPVWELDNGDDGTQGTFSIEMIEGKESRRRFDGRYNLAFENLEFEGSFPMADPSECEFGDVISIQNIKVKNTGQMPLPKYQEVHFCIQDAGHPNVNPLISRRDAFLPAGNSCGPGEYAMSEGELKLFAGFPGEVDDEYDFDPLKQMAQFHIQAFQYGPIHLNGKERTSDFKKEYKAFHKGDGSTVTLAFAPGVANSIRSKEEGVQFTLRYPVENSDGLIAARSLCPGERTAVSLNLTNVSARTLGGFDADAGKERPRRVAVRYFYLRSRMYDLPSDFVHCHVDKGNGYGPVIDLVEHPKLLDVPAIEPGKSHDFKISLAIDEEVAPYSRMALIVDVFVEALPLPKGIQIEHENFDTDEHTTPMSVVQRRKLEFICEPKYEQRNTAKFVLVTSYGTTRAQYETWTQHIFTDTLNLEYEVFSLSRYGSLDPAFVVENGISLRMAFRDKVVVVLTETFKENAKDKENICPVDLLPNGCMQQTSGYEASTRWLIVGVNETLTKNLLEKHLLASPEEGGDFPDVSSYHKHIQKLVDDRAARGHERDDLPIRVDTVNISLMTGNDTKAAQKVGKAAESLAEFLKNVDPLNQYTIEYVDHDFATQKKGIIKRKQTYLEVRRGFCRSLDSVICVAGKYCFEPKQIKTNGMIMSIAEAMPRERRVGFLAEAIRKPMPDTVLTAFKYACVSEMIREANVFLHSEMKMNDDLELSFPSIGALLDSVEMLALIRDCKASEELKQKACDQLSDLLARLELVANSKDLRPRFPLVGVSKKKTTLEAMTEIVARLRVQWKSVISNTLVEDVKKKLKAEVKEYLQEDAGKKMLNYRSDNRWIQGLSYIHSTDNDASFGISNASKRLMEFDLAEPADNHKIPPPSVRVESSHDMQSLRDEVVRGRDRCHGLADKIRSQRQFSIVAPKCLTEL
jgi:hypothetical protein